MPRRAIGRSGRVEGFESGTSSMSGRATEETEETGLDLAEHGEAGYALTERGATSGGPPVGWIPEGLGPEGVPEPTVSETFVRAVAERVEKLQTGGRS